MAAFCGESGARIGLAPAQSAEKSPVRYENLVPFSNLPAGRPVDIVNFAYHVNIVVTLFDVTDILYRFHDHAGSEVALFLYRYIRSVSLLNTHSITPLCCVNLLASSCRCDSIHPTYSEP